MLSKFKSWLLNAPIGKKFLPIQIIIYSLVLLITINTITAVVTVNNSSRLIIDENVLDREALSQIVRTMYVCRVLGRDILLQDDIMERQLLYIDYIYAFNNLDDQMSEYAQNLSGAKYDQFMAIIAEKEIYKDSMLLSAEIKMTTDDFDAALEALTSVTPIANDFFGSIDSFMAEEEALMEAALNANDTMVSRTLLLVIIANIVVLILLIVIVRIYIRAMSFSLISLEQSVSAIAATGNMRIDIPAHLFTKDEIGQIAVVVDQLKTMLLENSYTDVLTGGLNATAYHEQLKEIFANKNATKFWCIISDMNNLKLINDHLGHIEGDNAIRTSYAVLDEQFKEFGKTFRVGGDEFVSLLFNCDEATITSRLVLVSDRIKSLNTNDQYQFSLACGYSQFSGSTRSDFDDFFKVVDKQMYKHKTESKQARLNARVVPEQNSKS